MKWLVSFTKTCLVLGFVLGMLALLANKATANDIYLFQTIFDTDATAAGVGKMRDVGSGTITLSGVSGTVTKAYLYWHGPTNSSDPNANASVLVNGNAAVGTNIGFSSDNCWDYLNSQAYRADVTSLVAITGNGTYSLTGFGSGDVNTNGASLIVFFDDGNPSNNRDVVLFEGNDSNTVNDYDALGWNVTLSGINYSSGTASINLHVGDGQLWEDAPLILNTLTLDPGPQIFDGISVPPGDDNEMGLWDIKSFDVTSYLSPGLNTLVLTTGDYGDCLSLVVAAIDLPAGAAPGNQNQPPDVSEAAPTISCIWPPNHKFVDVGIVGVTDPDGDPVIITITTITSDEPTATIKGAGGITHAPDAMGVGTSTANLRAERSGLGNGRVYEISFIANDGKGGKSKGKVQVRVPHDIRMKTCNAIDDGQIYDATQ
ncbi:MAG: DUF3344 domain-containing protein [Nitrospirae bacterium]|nr:DUF3344 domain-containing protein [Nitrospirota bacterium]